ncbi:MAG: hypothetical protein ACI4BB_03250 [Coprococcus sp.]
MLKRKYQIVMQTPIGGRAGTLEIQIEQNTISGYMNLLKRSEPFEGSIDENGYCSIRGKLITLMNTIPYTATGQITMDSLDLSLQGGRNRFSVKGTVIKEDQEDIFIF